MGHWKADTGCFEGSSQAEAGLTLSGAAPTRESWMDRGRVGDLGSGSQGEVLSTDRRGRRAVGRGEGALAEFCRGDGERAEHGEIAVVKLWVRVFRLRLLALFKPSVKEDDLASEMDFHMQMQIEENLRLGMEPKKARSEAIREFGGAVRYEEECRDAWGTRFLENLFRHLRLAGKQLLKNRGYTVIAIITLGLGIGVNTAIYSLANAVLFQPLPFEEGDRIIHLTERSDERGVTGLSYPNFVDWKDRQSSFSEFGVGENFGYNLIENNGATGIQGVVVSYDYIDVLRISPLIGRAFTEEDDRIGAEATVMLGESMWRNHYGARDSIIGERINLTGQMHTVIGIMPYDFQYGDADVWTPLGLRVGEGFYPKRTARMGLRALARLKPEVSLDQARSEMERIAGDLAVEYPRANAGMSVRVKKLQDVLSSGSRTTLLPLLGASGFLLLIACANVAIMQIVRSLARRHEFGIRVSLGASRGQVLGQLLVENMVLGLVGGLAGIFLAYGSIEWLKSVLEYQLPRMDEVEIDTATLAYATAASVFSSLLFGLVPMRQALRLSPKHALGTVARTSASGLGKRWTALVVGEFALTCTLLVGAGLMIRTTVKLYQSSPGFQTEERLVFNWGMEGAEYDSSKSRLQAIDRAYKELIQIPGMEQVGAAYPVPFTGNGYGQHYFVEGQPVPKGSRGRSAEQVWVNDTYFEAMGIRLVEGRLFNEFDTLDSPKVAVVDVDFWKTNFPNENPIGKRFAHSSKSTGESIRWIQIVGVVEHVAYAGIQNEAREQMYHPIRQEIQGVPPWISFVLKTKEDPVGVGDAVRRSMAEIDSSTPVRNYGSFDSKIDSSFVRERLMMQLLGILAGLALLLASVGLYGVLSYGVQQQTREFGIRIAIGAEPRALTLLVVKNGILLSITGILGGLICSAALSRFLSNLLYDVSEFDLVTFGFVAGVLLVIGLIACWVPARRASRIDPMEALRAD